jgi:hypothetical protein
MRLLLPLAFGLFATLLSGCPQPVAKPTPWLSYSSPDGKFTAKFPKEPLQVDAPAPVIKVRATLHNDQVIFAIQYVEGLAPDQAAQIMANGAAAEMKARNGVLLDDRAIALGEWQGRACSFSAVENNVPMIHHTRIYVVGTRVYILTASGKQGVLDDGDADEFLRSFAITGG